MHVPIGAGAEALTCFNLQDIEVRRVKIARIDTNICIFSIWHPCSEMEVICVKEKSCTFIFTIWKLPYRMMKFEVHSSSQRREPWKNLYNTAGFLSRGPPLMLRFYLFLGIYSIRRCNYDTQLSSSTAFKKAIFNYQRSHKKNFHIKETRGQKRDSCKFVNRANKYSLPFPDGKGNPGGD